MNRGFLHGQNQIVATDLPDVFRDCLIRLQAAGVVALTFRKCKGRLIFDISRSVVLAARVNAVLDRIFTSLECDFYKSNDVFLAQLRDERDGLLQ